MKALIIGAAGFVGSYLIEHLSNAYDWEIHATKLEHENLEVSNAHVHNLNIMNAHEMDALLKDVLPDYIFHLAAQSSVALSWKNPSLTVDINIKGTLNMLEASRQHGVKKFVYASSSSVYGDEPNLPKQEGREGNLLSPYALTKQVNEEYAKLYSLYTSIS